MFYGQFDENGIPLNLVCSNFIPDGAVELTETAYEELIANPGGLIYNLATSKTNKYTPPGPSNEDLMATARSERDRLLTESDKRIMPDRWEMMDTATREAWASYRQALRDLPNDIVDPANVVWPTEPGTEPQ